LNVLDGEIWTAVTELDSESFGEFHNFDSRNASRILESVGVFLVNPGLHGVMRLLLGLEVGVIGFHDVSFPL
jgi:hypothetical protein